MTVIVTARTSEINVTRTRNITTRAPSAQPEFDRDFHDDVDRLAAPGGRREAPLSDGIDGLGVEPAAQALKNAHVADRAVTTDDDFEDNLAFEALPPGFLGVISPYFLEQPRRLDPAAGAIGSAAGSAARPFADTRTLPGTKARSGPGSGAAARSPAVTVVLGRGFFGHADARPVVGRRGYYRRDNDWQLLGLERRFRLRLGRVLHLGN